jgi:hypothetical protein
MERLVLTDVWEDYLTLESNSIGDISLTLLDRDYLQDKLGDIDVNEAIPMFILNLGTAIQLRDFLSGEIRLIERCQKERGEEDV